MLKYPQPPWSMYLQIVETVGYKYVQMMETVKQSGLWSSLGRSWPLCIFSSGLCIHSGGETGHNGILPFEDELEGHGQSLPKIIGILTKMFCTSGPNLVILAWTGDELWCRQAQCWHTHTRTDRRRQRQYLKAKKRVLNKNCYKCKSHRLPLNTCITYTHSKHHSSCVTDVSETLISGVKLHHPVIYHWPEGIHLTKDRWEQPFFSEGYLPILLSCEPSFTFITQSKSLYWNKLSKRYIIRDKPQTGEKMQAINSEKSC